MVKLRLPRKRRVSYTSLLAHRPPSPGSSPVRQYRTKNPPSEPSGREDIDRPFRYLSSLRSPPVFCRAAVASLLCLPQANLPQGLSWSQACPNAPPSATPPGLENALRCSWAPAAGKPRPGSGSLPASGTVRCSCLFCCLVQHTQRLAPPPPPRLRPQRLGCWSLRPAGPRVGNGRDGRGSHHLQSLYSHHTKGKLRPSEQLRPPETPQRRGTSCWDWLLGPCLPGHLCTGRWAGVWLAWWAQQSILLGEFGQVPVRAKGPVRPASRASHQASRKGN